MKYFLPDLFMSLWGLKSWFRLYIISSIKIFSMLLELVDWHLINPQQASLFVSLYFTFVGFSFSSIKTGNFLIFLLQFEVTSRSICDAARSLDCAGMKTNDWHVWSLYGKTPAKKQTKVKEIKRITRTFKCVLFRFCYLRLQLSLAMSFHYLTNTCGHRWFNLHSQTWFISMPARFFKFLNHLYPSLVNSFRAFVGEHLNWVLLYKRPSGKE